MTQERLTDVLLLVVTSSKTSIVWRFMLNCSVHFLEFRHRRVHVVFPILDEKQKRTSTSSSCGPIICRYNSFCAYFVRRKKWLWPYSGNVLVSLLSYSQRSNSECATAINSRVTRGRPKSLPVVDCSTRATHERHFCISECSLEFARQRLS